MACSCCLVLFSNLRLFHYFLVNPSLYINSALIFGNGVALSHIVKAFPFLHLTTSAPIETTQLCTFDSPRLSFKECVYLLCSLDLDTEVRPHIFIEAFYMAMQLKRITTKTVVFGLHQLSLVLRPHDQTMWWSLLAKHSPTTTS